MVNEDFIVKLVGKDERMSKKLERFLRLARRCVRYFNRIRLKNRSFSLVTNNCVGGIISHDMHLQFRSPTINLFFENNDFIIFLEHLKYYLSLELMPVETDRPYPVAVLKGMYGDVRVFFMHYHSFEEAKDKWNARKERMDYDNLFVIMESQKCDKSIVEKFDRLPYNHKAIITDRKYSDIKCSIAMKEGFYEKGYHNGKLLEYPKYGLRRYLDRFDYVSFFNRGMVKRRFL